MATATSNAAAIAAHVRALADAVDLTGGIGTDALDLIATMISDRTTGAQMQPDGSPLKELSEGYLKSKARKGQPALVTVATGETLSMEQLRGTRTIAADEATMVYGTADDARQKAGWLTDQGRAFYATDAEIDAAVTALFEAHLARVLGMP